MKTIEQLKVEFQKHVNSRECEKPSKEMLFEFFVEGYKLGHPGKAEPKKQKSENSELPNTGGLKS